MALRANGLRDAAGHAMPRVRHGFSVCPQTATMVAEELRPTALQAVRAVMTIAWVILGNADCSEGRIGRTRPSRGSRRLALFPSHHRVVLALQVDVGLAATSVATRLIVPPVHLHGGSPRESLVTGRRCRFRRTVRRSERKVAWLGAQGPASARIVRHNSALAGGHVDRPHRLTHDQTAGYEPSEPGPWPPSSPANVPSGPAGAGSSTGGPGTFLPGTPLTDSVEYANVSCANAIRSLLTSSACRSTLSMVSHASW